jgi:hypothetical protein
MYSPYFQPVKLLIIILFVIHILVWERLILRHSPVLEIMSQALLLNTKSLSSVSLSKLSFMMHFILETAKA